MVLTSDQELDAGEQAGEQAGGQAGEQAGGLLRQLSSRLLPLVCGGILLEFAEACIAVWLMNFLYWVQVFFLYYMDSWERSLQYFESFVNDIFGWCVQGFAPFCYPGW